MEQDGVHFTNPFETGLLTNAGINFNYSFVVQYGNIKMCYIEYDILNETAIRDVINNSSINTDYQISEKTVEEAKSFINIAFGNDLISSEIVGDTVNFEIIAPN